MKFKFFARLKKDKPAAKTAGSAPQARPVPARQPEEAQKNSMGLENPVPYGEVSSMIANGLSEAEIIQLLKDDGYSFRQIDEALNATLKNAVTGDVPEEPLPEQGFSSGSSSARKDSTIFGHDFPSQGEFGTTDEDFAPVNAQTQNDTEAKREIEEYNRRMEEIEDIVGALIKEKIGQIEEAKRDMENQVMLISKEMQAIRQELALQKERTADVTGKEQEDVIEIRARIDDVEPRLKALEKAFKDIVPNLIDNVRDIRERIAEENGGVGERDYPEGMRLSGHNDTRVPAKKENPESAGKKEKYTLEDILDDDGKNPFEIQ